jgi:hypothetical protein
LIAISTVTTPGETATSVTPTGIYSGTGTTGITTEG